VKPQGAVGRKVKREDARCRTSIKEHRCKTGMVPAERRVHAFLREVT
jgi:hypothetical protein